MQRRIMGFVLVVAACFCVGTTTWAQDFSLFNREIQIHGFASQGFVYTDQNNWLTMNTSENSGSADFTDFGANISTSITSKLHVGAQIYDRNLGELGKWHPDLDWGYASYRLRPWFSFRAGKVKTALGLFNDTQDLDFLRPYVLLPQSVYPTDLRDSTIAHLGGDVYGDVRLKHHMGTLTYTAYVGHRSDSPYGGYPYLLSTLIHFTSYGGLQYGGDIRWATPLKGLLLGVSRLDEDITGKGTAALFGPPGPYQEHSKADWADQFYGQYTIGKFELDSEWRRYIRNQEVFNGTLAIETDVHGNYVAGAYRFTKWFQFGSYYSRYSIVEPASAFGGATSGHTYDKVVSGRFDVNRFLYFKVEGHFMAGVGLPGAYPDGFYTANNPQGLKPNTNALILKCGFNF
jgi:hypothetical protein